MLVNGYSGNGTIELQDFAAANLISPVFLAGNFQSHELDLDVTSFVASVASVHGINAGAKPGKGRKRSSVPRVANLSLAKVRIANTSPEMATRSVS